VSTVVDLNDLQDGLASNTKAELASKPDVVDWGGSLDVASLPIEVRRWVKVTEVVAVVADPEELDAGSTASIYQAATGGVVDIYDQFDADFIQIQGDSAFALNSRGCVHESPEVGRLS
jgi:hypothetical protein